MFQTNLDAALDAMLAGPERRGYRVPKFALAFDAILPNGSPFHGEMVTGYAGAEGADALARAALRVLDAGG